MNKLRYQIDTLNDIANAFAISDGRYYETIIDVYDLYEVSLDLYIVAVMLELRGVNVILL